MTWYGSQSTNNSVLLNPAFIFQYPGVGKSINSDINNLMSILNVWKILPEGVCNIWIFLWFTTIREIVQPAVKKINACRCFVNCYWLLVKILQIFVKL